MKTFYYQTRTKEWILRKYYILWISKLLYVVLPLLNRIDKIYTSYINCKMSGGSKKIHRHPGRRTKMYLGIKTFLLPVLLYCKLQFCSLVTHTDLKCHFQSKMKKKSKMLWHQFFWVNNLLQTRDQSDQEEFVA